MQKTAVGGFNDLSWHFYHQNLIIQQIKNAVKTHPEPGFEKYRYFNTVECFMLSDIIPEIIQNPANQRQGSNSMIGPFQRSHIVKLCHA